MPFTRIVIIVTAVVVTIVVVCAITTTTMRSWMECAIMTMVIALTVAIIMVNVYAIIFRKSTLTTSVTVIITVIWCVIIFNSINSIDMFDVLIDIFRITQRIIYKRYIVITCISAVR